MNGEEPAKPPKHEVQCASEVCWLNAMQCMGRLAALVSECI